MWGRLHRFTIPDRSLVVSLFLDLLCYTNTFITINEKDSPYLTLCLTENEYKRIRSNYLSAEAKIRQFCYFIKRDYSVVLRQILSIHTT
jgi:plasmid rolling circle replication initiator protein Rep